jgi:hypothetical protein
METLHVAWPGQAFLIGAGVLGKVYCHRVKELGGVAIDVGSLIDAWAGVESRLRFARFRECFSIDRHERLGSTDRSWTLANFDTGESREYAGIWEFSAFYRGSRTLPRPQ